MRIVKYVFFSGILIAVFTLFAGCGKGKVFAVIEECRNVDNTPDCKACCIENGFDTGKHLRWEGNCQCNDND